MTQQPTMLRIAPAKASLAANEYGPGEPGVASDLTEIPDLDSTGTVPTRIGDYVTIEDGVLGQFARRSGAEINSRADLGIWLKEERFYDVYYIGSKFSMTIVYPDFSGESRTLSIGLPSFGKILLIIDPADPSYYIDAEGAARIFGRSVTVHGSKTKSKELMAWSSMTRCYSMNAQMPATIRRASVWTSRDPLPRASVRPLLSFEKQSGERDLAARHASIASTDPAEPSGGDERGTCPLDDQFALLLSQARHDMKEEPSCRCRRVDAVDQTPEVDLPLLELGHKVDQTPDAASWPVELPHHQRIAFAGR